MLSREKVELFAEPEVSAVGGELPLGPPSAMSVFSLLKELYLCPLCVDQGMKRDLYNSAKAL